MTVTLLKVEKKMVAATEVSTTKSSVNRLTSLQKTILIFIHRIK